MSETLPDETPQADTPQAYVGWARPAGGVWREVPPSRAANRADCLTRLVDAIELCGGQELNNDLMVLPEGVRPPRGSGEDRGQGRNAYRDRMMRPHV